MATTNLAFNHVNNPGFHKFVKKLDPKFHIKSARTFVRSKLPLLYKLVTEAVTNKIVKDLKEGAVGVAFTTDMWSSR